LNKALLRLTRLISSTHFCFSFDQCVTRHAKRKKRIVFLTEQHHEFEMNYATLT